MPPRNRTPKAPDVAEDSSPVVAETPADKPVKHKATAVILSDFSVAKKADLNIPVKHRPRDTNPFDDIIAESYKADQERTDDYVVFLTEELSVKDQLKLIRSAAAFHNIGARIRVGEPFLNEDNVSVVEVAFRGQAKKTRKPKTNDAQDSQDEGRPSE